MAIGCMFARTIANRPRYHRQAVEVIEAGTPARVAKRIEDRIGALIAKPEVAAAALIFPKLTSLESLAKALLALQGQPNWELKFGTLDHPQLGELVTVAIVRLIPTQEGKMIPSEALVLGPFSEFPRTRQSPVSALEIFVGEPLQLDPKTGGIAAKANLAHMKIRLPTQQAFERLMELSSAGRAKSLGGPDDRAKAKVSFVLTKAQAKSLGIGQ